MNMLLIKTIFVGFMVYEIPRVSVFGHCPYSVTLLYYDFFKSDCSSIYYKKKVCNCNYINYIFFEYRAQLWYTTRILGVL